MSLTTDPNDPNLNQTGDNGMQKSYLVLSDEECAKGFIRPVRRTYIHVGIGGNEVDPNDMSKSGLKGNGCGAATTMGLAIAETYARDPKFYGATYCVGCKAHFPVKEFHWDGSAEEVGS